MTTKANLLAGKYTFSYLETSILLVATQQAGIPSATTLVALILSAATSAAWLTLRAARIPAAAAFVAEISSTATLAAEIPLATTSET